MDKNGQGTQVVVGMILGPVGLRGEMKIEVLSDVHWRFSDGATLSIDGSPYRIQYVRSAAKGMVIKLLSVDSRQSAEALWRKSIYVSERDVPPPPEDTYYYYQVLGMEVVTVEGDPVGDVTDILATGANDVYVVRLEGKETLIPALAEVVVGMDVAARRMTVSLPEWL